MVVAGADVPDVVGLPQGHFGCAKIMARLVGVVCTMVNAVMGRTPGGASQHQVLQATIGVTNACNLANEHSAVLLEEARACGGRVDAIEREAPDCLGPHQSPA